MHENAKTCFGAFPLTVCTATFNVLGTCGAEALERCIRSVSALETDHEHIVCDGASTDGTLDILIRLATEIPTLKIVSEPDRGIYDALNKGLARACGEFFYVLGSDDFLCDPSALGLAVAQAERDREDVFISSVRLGDGRAVPSPWRDVVAMDLGMAYSHQGTFIRTSFARGLGGYDRTYRLSADYKLHLAAHFRGARVGLSRRVFAQYGLAGLSTAVAAQTVRDECARARCEVFGLTDSETERQKRLGNLPLRVTGTLLRQTEPYSRRFGFSCLKHWIWHKHRLADRSIRCLCGIPVWTKLRKERR